MAWQFELIFNYNFHVVQQLLALLPQSVCSKHIRHWHGEKHALLFCQLVLRDISSAIIICIYIHIYLCLCLYVGLCALSYFIHLQASALTYSKYINASVVGGNNSILAFKYKCWQQRHDLLPLATRTTTRPHVGCDSQQQRAYQPVYCRAVWPSSFFHSCSIDVLANVGFFFGSSSVSWLKFVAFFSDVQSTYVYLSVQIALANMYLHAATFFANLYKHVYVYVCKWQRWIRIILSCCNRWIFYFIWNSILVCLKMNSLVLWQTVWQRCVYLFILNTYIHIY